MQRNSVISKHLLVFTLFNPTYGPAEQGATADSTNALLLSQTL